MKIALLGLPGSGKTTLFTAITGIKPDEKDRLKPHLGTVFVPDERLNNLADILNPKKVTFTEIRFVDTHGLDIVHAKEADALILTIGVFSEGSSKKEAEELCANLILSDLQILENRLPKMKKEIEAGKEVKQQMEYNLLLKCKTQLDKTSPLRELEFTKDERKLISGYQFLSLKPMFFVANIAEDQIGKALNNDFLELAKKEGVEVIDLCTKIELEILELAEEERPDFMKGLGIKEFSEERVIKTAYKTLGLISFFTVKGDESKSWSVKEGSPAIEAAGKVHTDIQRGFIKAEVISYKDFMEVKNFAEAKKRALLRLEGREYVVQDGDIINFKFSV